MEPAEKTLLREEGSASVSQDYRFCRGTPILTSMCHAVHLLESHSLEHFYWGSYIIHGKRFWSAMCNCCWLQEKLIGNEFLYKMKDKILFTQMLFYTEMLLHVHTATPRKFSSFEPWSCGKMNIRQRQIKGRKHISVTIFVAGRTNLFQKVANLFAPLHSSCLKHHARQKLTLVLSSCLSSIGWLVALFLPKNLNHSGSQVFVTCVSCTICFAPRSRNT